MKKILALLCIGVLTSVVLSGCSADPNDEISSESTFTAETTPQEEKANAPENGHSQFENQQSENIDVTIEPTLIYDANNIKATAHDLVRDASGYYYIDINIENNSENDIDWIVDYWTVNEINIPCSIMYTVNAGTKGETSYCILTSDLNNYGIETINTVQLHMYYDIDYQTQEYIDSEIITTSAGSDYELSIPIDMYTTIYDGNGLKLYFKDITDGDFYYPEDEESEYYTQANMWVHNDTDTSMYVYPQDVSHDGTMDYDNYTCYYVYPHSYSEIYIESYDDLRNASRITFDFAGFDFNTDNKIVNENITFNVN